MAGALWKKEVVIRQNSTVTVAGGQNWTKNWLNSFQDDSSNIDQNGEYIDFFFADLFDSRTGNLYRIFTDAAGTRFNMTDTVFDILDTSKYVAVEDVSDNPNLTVDQSKLSTRGSLLQFADNAMNDAWTTLSNTFIPRSMVSNDPDLANNDDFLITRGGIDDVLENFISNARVINDAGNISNNKMTLSYTPSGGIIGGTCRIKIGSTNVFDDVECTVNGDELTILPDAGDDYDGSICLVSYLIN
jgi:hypothetical protein